MSGIFSYDNPIFSLLGKIVDIITLSLLWTILCLPIVTIGPATTAFYYVIVKVIRKERSYVFREFFRAFKTNFKQGAIVTLIAVILGVVLYFDFNFAKAMMGILPKEEFKAETINAGLVADSAVLGSFTVNPISTGTTSVEEVDVVMSNGTTSLRAVRLGAGSVKDGNISFKTQGDTDIVVYAISTSENTSELYLADAEGNVIETAVIQSIDDFEVIPATTFTVETAGDYYIYVSDSETEIYYMSTATLIETTEFQQKMGYAMYVVFMALILMLALTLMFIFPVLSRFKMTFKQLCRSSFFMAMRHLPTTILVAFIVAVTAFATWFLWPYPTFIILPGLCCLLVSFPMERVFKKYMPTKEEVGEPDKDLWYLE